MINEEIANKVVSIEINVLKATYQEILNNINKLHHRYSLSQKNDLR